VDGPPIEKIWSPGSSFSGENCQLPKKLTLKLAGPVAVAVALPV
jgi:hypothetical protein